jgi:prophage antirepressor-like protein
MKADTNSRGSTAIQAFVFPQTNQKVRVFVDPDGTLWFVATDVCRMLGYVNSPQAVTRHCKPKGISKRYTLTNAGRQEVTVIDERNLYRLMGKSEAPNADPFQDCLYGEVLPSIRKTGSYGHKPQPQFDPTNLDHVRGVLSALSAQSIKDQETIEALKIETKEVTTLVITPPV